MGTVDTTGGDLSKEVAKEVEKVSPSEEQAESITAAEERWYRQTSGVGLIQDLPPEPQEAEAEEVEAEAEEVEDERPAGNAGTEEWRDYRLSHGYSEDELTDDEGEPLGRDDLRALEDR